MVGIVLESPGKEPEVNLYEKKGQRKQVAGI